MFRKRIAAYKKMGYRIETSSETETDRDKKQGELFGSIETKPQVNNRRDAKE
jgi:hypothetical protein